MPGIPQPNDRKTRHYCIMDDCDRPVMGRGLCSRHYQQARRVPKGRVPKTPLSREERRAKELPQEAARRRQAREFVAQVRAETVCARCGAQPIDWHCEAHHEKPNRRVARLAGIGSTIGSIKREIARCTPLCRRCHMTEDGRLAALPGRKPDRRGTQNGRAKLNEDVVRELRQRLAAGNLDRIESARLYNVSLSALRLALEGKTWRHVQPA